MRKLATIGFILLLTTSCQNKFEGKKWKIEEDLRSYPFREKMISDIIDNKKLIGFTFVQILDSLGRPNLHEEGQLIYSVKVNYGSDIDPIYTKDLVLTIDKDSLVTDVLVKEWRK